VSALLQGKRVFFVCDNFAIIVKNILHYTVKRYTGVAVRNLNLEQRNKKQDTF
jgi:hypothetical protein